MAEQADLLPGTLDVLILKSVSLGPLHGYAVLRADRADHAGRAARRTGRALPRPLPARAPGAARHRVGHVGEQPAREVLQPHRRGPEAAARGNRQLEPSRRRRCRRRSRRARRRAEEAAMLKTVAIVLTRARSAGGVRATTWTTRCGSTSRAAPRIWSAAASRRRTRRGGRALEFGSIEKHKEDSRAECRPPAARRSERRRALRVADVREKQGRSPRPRSSRWPSASARTRRSSV